MCKSIKVLFEMLQSCVVLIVSSLLSLRWNDDMFSGVMTANKECWAFLKLSRFPYLTCNEIELTLRCRKQNSCKSLEVSLTNKQEGMNSQPKGCVLLESDINIILCHFHIDRRHMTNAIIFLLYLKQNTRVLRVCHTKNSYYTAFDDMLTRVMATNKEYLFSLLSILSLICRANVKNVLDIGKTALDMLLLRLNGRTPHIPFCKAAKGFP